jgi:glycosyltransferase involved in cell wall biosynthesis
MRPFGKKKKVLAFVPLPPPYAGPEIATERLLRLIRLPKNCEIITLKSNVRTENSKKGSLDLHGLFSAGKTLGKLIYYCLKHRPQKVYFLLSSSKMGFLRDLFIIFLSRLFLCKVIAHYHGSLFEKFYHKQSVSYRFLIRFGLGRIDQMIVLGENLKSVFQNIYPKNNISVLYNGLSSEIISRNKELQLKENSKINILFLNHISFTKGFYEIILAGEKLLDIKNQFRFLIAGDISLNKKNQAEFLDGLAKKNYLENHEKIHRKIHAFLKNNTQLDVQYLDVIEGEKKQYTLEQADVFILPSYTEALPYSMLEAMTVGLPLIVSAVGAIPEVLQENQNALFVEPGNPDMLAKQLRLLISDKDMRQRMGENNFKLVREKFNIETIQKKFIEILFS